MARIIFLCSFIILLTGCASRISSDEIRSSVSSGHINDLEKEMKETHEEFSEFVTALNLARLLQIKGNWQESIQRYNEALRILEEYESRAIINVRNVAATIGTIFLARGAEEYYGTGYERSLLHTFNSLNYVMLGDFTGAAVEMRKMDQRQEYWLQESQSRIEKNLRNSYKEETLPVQYSMRDMLQDEAVRKLINNYQDPFSYALSTILFRIAGDRQAAEVNLRRAMALDDNVENLFRQAWNQPIQEKKKTNKKSHLAIPELPSRNTPVRSDTDSSESGVSDDLKQQEVTVIAMSGLTPSLQVEHVRIRFPVVGYILVDLPSYSKALTGPMPMAFTSQMTPLVFYPLLRTDRLAYRTLQDEVNLELGAAFSRAATRAGISAAVYAGAKSNEDTRDFAPVASLVTTMLLDLWTYSMSVSARNWEMLPKEGYIAMTLVKNGSTITVGEGAAKQSIVLPNDVRGVIIMLTYLSKSYMRVDYVTY